MMQKRWIGWLFLSSLVFLLVACAAPAEPTPAATQAAAPSTFPMTLTDAMTRTVTLEAAPQRIISLAPGNTEVLYAVGAGPQVVGRDMFSDYPTEVQAVEDIGGGFGDLNTEKIVSLQPDLIMASALTPPDQVKALEALNLKVYVLANPDSLEGMFANLILVGQITGHDAQAKTLVESLEARLAALQQKTSAVTERPVVFYELDSSDPNAPWTPGPGTFIDKLLALAGGENLGNLLDVPWGQINIETLIEKDPDLIILGDSAAVYGGITPESVAARPGWETLTAVKEGKVYPIDDNLVSRPGPRMLDGLETLARLLHPQLFQ